MMLLFSSPFCSVFIFLEVCLYFKFYSDEDDTEVIIDTHVWFYV